MSGGAARRENAREALQIKALSGIIKDREGVENGKRQQRKSYQADLPRAWNHATGVVRFNRLRRRRGEQSRNKRRNEPTDATSDRTIAGAVQRESADQSNRGGEKRFKNTASILNDRIFVDNFHKISEKPLDKLLLNQLKSLHLSDKIGTEGEKMTHVSISQAAIGGLNQPAVNARDLHTALEISKDFSNWVKNQIARAELREGVDFIAANPNEAAPQGFFALEGENKMRDPRGRKSIDYLLTLDSAKHIAMMSQSQKAKAIRDYFIAVEREWRLGACPLLRGACGGEAAEASAANERLAKKAAAYDEISAKLPEAELKTHNAMALAAEAYGAVRDLLRVDAKINPFCGREHKARR
jgi:phage anti-repressor protein